MPHLEGLNIGFENYFCLVLTSPLTLQNIGFLNVNLIGKENEFKIVGTSTARKWLKHYVKHQKSTS